MILSKYRGFLVKSNTNTLLFKVFLVKKLKFISPYY